MPFVIPKWTAHSVRDWDELQVNTADDVLDIAASAGIELKEPLKDLLRLKAATKINEATAALINCLLLIGVTGIRAGNVDDVWRRIAIHEALFGSFLKDVNNQPLFFTKSDVERHIGIETEVKHKNFEAFCSDIQGRLLEADGALLPSFVANGNRTLLQAVGIRQNGKKGKSE